MNYNKSLFAGVPKKHANKSKFNLSHEYKAQMGIGYLTPILVQETLPLDNFEINTEFMFRFTPLYFPVMQKFTMRCDYFYVPNRILWNEGSGANIGWKKWIADPVNEILPPTFDGQLRELENSWNNNVLAFMGLPILKFGAAYHTIITELNAFPLSAYLKIWDEYYRNPQLEGERWFNLSSGDNTSNFIGAWQPWISSASPGLLELLPSKWEMDYFTSALPTPQIGEAVKIPSLGIDEDGSYLPQKLRNLDGTIAGAGHSLETDADSDLKASGSGAKVVLENNATIKQLRLAEVLQSFYERIMKVGQRYRDYIEGLWGDDPEPMAVDVPVLIGSKFGKVQISDVMTQAYTNGTDFEQRTGNYVGQANLYENGGGTLRYYCREHGWIMAILQVNPNTSYGNGVQRKWRRMLQTDYALDIFSGIGDQEILKEEVAYNNITADVAKNQETFGYIPRFSEYRYENNKWIGDLGKQNGIGINQHGGRILRTDELPLYDDLNINEYFVSTIFSSENLANMPLRTGDMFSVLPDKDGNTTNVGEATIFAHIFHSIFVERALPMFSTPQL